MQTNSIRILPLRQADLTGYGQPILIPLDARVDGSGPGWVAWFPVGVLTDEPARQIGRVRTSATSPITVMEMHPRRSEVVLAIDRPVVQVLALGDAQGPNPATARAVVVWPGEGLQVNAGVWHGVGLPYHEETTDYWFILAAASAQDQAEETGWTRFIDDGVLWLE